MSQLLVVLVDDQVLIEFDHAKPVPENQLAYLDQMDRRMDDGIELQGEFIADPNEEQRAKFVAQNMAMLLGEGQDQAAVAMCTYLGVRRPALKQVKISSTSAGISVDLDHENVYQKPAPEPQVVMFNPKLNS
ncbi:MAG: hypothetical protein ACO378_07200 [Sedimenticolaceae bacterium]|jgi:hypothetical protein